MMLAWRYLNPRRALLSVVALISVIGVIFGVFVLVTVMSVYSGMEREVKSRLLGFIPHVRLHQGLGYPIKDWREKVEEMKAVPGVVEAGPFIQDSMLIDVDGFRAAGSFRAIDTSDPTAVKGIEAMLDLEEYPESSADMGYDDYVVISSRTATAYRAGIGDTISLLTIRNLQEVEAAYNKTNQPPAREQHAEALSKIQKKVKESWADKGDSTVLTTQDWNSIFESISSIIRAGVRSEEEKVLDAAYSILDTAVNQQETQTQVFEKGAREEFLKTLEALDTLDVEQMDLETLKGIEEFVLPKEATVIGVYQSSQMAMTPDVFMPLHLAQELAGYEDAVQAVAVRLDDPYQAGLVADKLVRHSSEDWRAYYLD